MTIRMFATGTPGPKRFTIPLRVALAVVVVGLVFKIQHWPMAMALVVTGASAIVLLYPFRYAAKSEKTFLDHVKLGLAILWPASVVFQQIHWPYAKVIGLLASAFGLVWITQAGVAEFWTDEQRSSPSRWSVALFALGLVLVSVGTLFRIQHWPFSTVLLIAGLGCCGAWAVVEFLLPKKQ